MKFVGDTLSFSDVSDDGATHTVCLPVYHRAAVGVFPGTRLFAVPLPSTNEVVLTPIDPSKWGDLWRLEATVSDRPGSAKTLVETLVSEKVNVLVHEGVSESAIQGKTVHQIFEILDLAKYSDPLDGTTADRNSVNRALLRPNRLINELIGNSAECLIQDHERTGWQMRLDRMEFFFRNKEARENAVELSLTDDNEVHVPANILRELEFGNDAKVSLPLHIISDTEQKYVKLRVLSTKRYYVLFEIEHAERVGAIDEFMGVFRAHQANMIDSYSRLKSIANIALFYALAEFSERQSASQVLDVIRGLAKSSSARRVVLKGAVGNGPALDDMKPQLPPTVSIRTTPARRAAPAAEHSASSDKSASTGDADESSSRLGTPYYLDRHDSQTWQLNPEDVFMAIPFAEDYQDFYEDNIASSVREVGLHPVRVDEMPVRRKRRHIVDRIEEGIARSRFVIADVSQWNPNVVYEVGLAVGISKPILLLCERKVFDVKGIPFDFQSYELIKYSPLRAKDLRSRLVTQITQLRDDTEALIQD
ncbi:MAG TPA: hypothetical protein VFQ14_04310 [Thermoleophilaceae bacterium]|nr:hypothetical protein [Thermoleophilaceae bacterium]